MRRPHWRCRADATQTAIVRTLRACGVSVELIGLPMDAIVGFRGKTYIVDFKSKGGKTTKLQDEFARVWKGGLVHYWFTVDDALDTLGLLHSKAARTSRGTC